MKKLLLVSLCFLLLSITQTFAQNRAVTGTVTGLEDGLPIPGVTIKVKGTTTGTQTSSNGKFTLSVPEGSTLVISFIGYATQEIQVKGPVVNVRLTTSSKQLGEVVVTGALGLNRTRNQQAYSAQQVTGDEVSKQRNSNFVSGLSGKVAGLEIRQNNALGGSTNVVLRGTKSLLGGNQALFVIDGVPINNGGPGAGNGGTNNAGANTGTNGGNVEQGRGGYDYGSPISNINPDDIESVTVLKGAAASALYGSIGANGVIMITTKKPGKGLGITFNSSVGIGSVDKKTLPTYQHEYGAGYGPIYNKKDGIDPSGYFLTQDVNNDGTTDLVAPMHEDASYGHRFDSNLKVYQWDSFVPTSPNFGKATPWVAAANDPLKFFKTQVSNNQSLFITNGGENGTFKLGYTRNNQTGVLPNSNILNNSLDFASTYKITSKLTAGASINYTRTDGIGRYGSGYQVENVVRNFRQWWQMNTDILAQKDAYFASGGKDVTWNWKSPTNLVPNFQDNPYWTRYKNFQTDRLHRYFGNVSLNYKVNDWLNLLGRVTVDNYTTLQEERRAFGSQGVSAYTRRNINFNETNLDFLATVDKNINPDLNFKGLVGVNVRKSRYELISAATNGGLIIPDVYALANSKNAPAAPTENDIRYEVDGLFAGATFTYKKMLVLDGTLRRDASSALPSYSNKFYYPAINLGFTFSELLKQYSWLSYGKVRVNYAEVGNGGQAQNTKNFYAFGTPFGSNPQSSIGTTQNNAALKPERSKAKEAGLEMQFFNSRLGFDFTYYDAKTVDGLLPVAISTATGYNSTYINSGTLRNRGVEIAVNGTPVNSKVVTWKIGVNFTKNNNKVVELYTDPTGQKSENLLLSPFQGGVSLNATLGHAYGDIRGTAYTDINGKPYTKKDGGRVVDQTGDNAGYYKQSPSNSTIGNVNPDWIGGITNSVRVQNFTLSFLIDIRKGGDVFSLDNYYGMDTGLYPETVGNNDLGNPSRNSLATGGGVIIQGIAANGNKNNIRVRNDATGLYGYEHNPAAAFVYDASYVKLREASLNYSFPQSLTSKWGPVKGVDVAVSGRNLWIIHKNLPYSDPEETLGAGNLQGYQSGAFPTIRTFTLNLKVRF